MTATTRIDHVLREFALLALTERDAERRRVCDAAYELIKDMRRALERVANSESDDAIRIAAAMVEAKHDRAAQ